MWCPFFSVSYVESFVWLCLTVMFSLVADASVVFDVIPAPLVSLESSMPYLLKHHNVTLTCNVLWHGEVVPGAAYRWFRDDRPVPKSSSSEFVLAGNRLVIVNPNRLRDVDGYFVCAVSYASHNSQLTIQSSHFLLKPAMIKRFQGDQRNHDQRVRVGSTAFLPCHKPDSYPGPLEISFKYGPEYFINSFSGERYFIGPSGLQIANLTREDSGFYKCIVKNNAKDQKRVSPTSVELTVGDTESSNVPEPRIIYPLIKQTTMRVFAGSNVTLECVVSGPEGIRANWTKYGEELPESSVKRFGNLILPNVNVGQSGTYLCRVDADRALSSRPFVQYILRVEEHLDVKLSFGLHRHNSDRLQLSCQANKKAILDITVDGKDILSLSHLISHSDLKPGGHSRWSLDLKLPVHPGVYQCVGTAKGPSGLMESQTDAVLVRLAESPSTAASTTTTSTIAPSKKISRDNVDMLPKITVAPRNTTNFAGATVLLNCNVEMANSAFWMKDDAKLILDSRMRSIGSASLNIDGVLLSDTGKYSCVAVNPFGNTTASAWLLVEGSDSDSYWIPFDNDFSSGMDSGYFPGGGKNVANPSKSSSVVAPASVDQGVDVSPGKGDTDESDDGNARPGALEPPVVHRLSDNSVMLVWDVNDALGKQIRLYKLQYKQIQPEKQDWRTVNLDLSSSTRNHVVNQLAPNSKYRFRVSAVLHNDSVVTGLRSAPFFLDSTATLPPSIPPTILSAEVLSPTSVKLFWEFPEGEAVVGYLVEFRTHYKGGSELPFMNKTVPNGSSREAVIPRLLPATSYEFFLLAFNTGGMGPRSKPKIESTLTKNGDKGVTSFTAEVHNYKTAGAANEKDDAINIPSNTTDGPFLTLLRKMDTDVMLAIAGSLVGVLLVIFVLCAIVCAIKDRKKKMIMKESKGKYKDASRRIYREQSFSKSKYPYSDVTSEAPSQKNGMTGYEGLLANNLTSVNLYPNPLDQYAQQVESEAEISDSDDPNIPLTTQTDAPFLPEQVTVPFPTNCHDSTFERGSSQRCTEAYPPCPALAGSTSSHSTSPLRPKPPASPGGSSSDQRTGTPHSFILSRLPPSAGDHHYSAHLFSPSPGHGQPLPPGGHGNPYGEYVGRRAGGGALSHPAPPSPTESLGQQLLQVGLRPDAAPSPTTSEEHPYWMRNLSPHASLSGRRRVIPSHEVTADPVQFNTFRPQRVPSGLNNGHGIGGQHHSQGQGSDSYGLVRTPTPHNQSFSNHSNS